MASDPRARPALLAQMAQRMAAGTQCAEEMASGTSRYTGRRGGTSHLARCTTGKLATGESSRGLSRKRRAGTRCQGPGGTGHLDKISHEAVSFRRRSVNCTSEKELLNAIQINSY